MLKQSVVIFMKNEGIVFVEANRAELLELEMPEPKAGQVVVKTAVSTISSGTERANLTGDLNISTGEIFTEAKFPRRAGYSSAGVVEKVGEGVTSVKPGDRVAMYWTLHQRYNCIPESQVYKIDDATSFNEAALWHIATFPLAAIRKCRLEIGESVIVMGQGVLGMMAVKLLKAAGAAPIIAVDPVAVKREQALKIGADYAVDPYAPEFANTVISLTGGGTKVAIEVTGLGKGLDCALDCMAAFGRVALLGCTRNSNFTIDYYRKVHGPGITLIGAHTNARPAHESHGGWWTARDDELAVQRLVKLGRLEFSSLIAEVHKPEAAAKVYGRLAVEKAFPLVQFDWSEY